ncbi:CaiD Enoyl-CoA hydratase/carnithine racemase [Rhabdaerophilaceae bacterium]
MAETQSASEGAQSASLDVVSYECGASEIWLNRPERLNALGVEMVQLLLNAIENLVENGATALFIRARGRSFCTGADLKERRTMSKEQQYAHNRAINAACNALAGAPVPTIAVINGVAMGGGLELALSCDIRIAAEGAMVGLTETRIGAIPGAGGTQRLPRLIGASQALYMMYSGEPVSARRALEIGLVNDCVPDEELDKFVARYREVLASRSPATARTLKRVVKDGIFLPIADGLECEHEAIKAIFGSADYAEGLAAFAEKRPPKFAR